VQIPIQNIYYLLCYAWHRLEEQGLVDLDPAEVGRPQDLLARVLSSGVRRLIRLGIDRGYVGREAEQSRLIGRIDFGCSMGRLLLQRARAHCRFDELSHDVLHNQIIKATLRRLLAVDDLAPDLKDELGGLILRLREISDIPLRLATFRGVQRHRNIRFYDFLLSICQLACRNLLVCEATGEVVFRDFIRDKRQMARLFEDFVRNFYALEQSEFLVSREGFCWWATAADDESARLLPQMTTDVSLVSSEQRIVVECKYYPETLQTNYGKASIRSSHLYQLFSYIQNLARVHPGQRIAGILLYPSVARSLDLRYEFHGIPVRVCTVDLDRNWREIHERLLSVLDASECSQPTRRDVGSGIQDEDGLHAEQIEPPGACKPTER